MTSHSFDSVSEMVDSISEDKAFNDELRERLQRRQLVSLLIAMRTAQDVSQEQIAAEMGCSQSRVSKLEAGDDHELRWKDVVAYAKVLDCDVSLMFSDRSMPLMDRVKHHAFKMRDALLEMVDLCGDDAVLSRGVAQAHVETFINVARLIQDSSCRLPHCPENREPYVRISHYEESVEIDEETCLPTTPQNTPDVCGESSDSVTA